MPEILLIFAEDGSVRWRPAGSARSNAKYNWIDGAACPLHGPWKVVPGGWSEKKQAAYEAFYVCKNDDCINRPARNWTSAHPAEDTSTQADDWESIGGDDPLG